MDGQKLQSKVYGGYAKAAQRIGLPFDVYRPSDATDPLATGNKVVSALPAHFTADGGYTFTFGTDGNGYALFPLGKANIYPSLNAVPNYPWVPGVDYLDEGTQIRMPNNIAYSGTCTGRGSRRRRRCRPVCSPYSSRRTHGFSSSSRR